MPLRTLGYWVMPNHWHMVVWPRDGLDHEVSDFLRWLTVTHAQRWHAHYHSSGSGQLYQGRYKSFPVESDEYLYTVPRYYPGKKVPHACIYQPDAPVLMLRYLGWLLETGICENGETLHMG